MSANAGAAGRVLVAHLKTMRRHDHYDPVTFAAVVVLLMVVALLACLLPTRSAATVDPFNALRGE